ncbi:alpha/beta fold hydrolase [Lysobacter sp. A289]
MRAAMIALGLSLLLASLPARVATAATDTTPAAAVLDPQAIASRFLDQLDAGDYAAAEATFTDRMATSVPVEKLKLVWEQLPVQLGPAGGRGEATVTQHDGMHIVVMPLDYGDAGVIAQIVITAEGRIAGFLVQPAAKATPVPPLAADATFIERDFSVGESDKTLPGTLAMPRSVANTGQRVPGVVLVHGSGPQDRNETVGPNRPFLDIARGLASHGIAVLRYDKRSKARPQDFADGDYEVDEETTDDAVAAVAALRATDGIDPARVYVLGHSQGAMLAPRIAAHSGHVAGLIMLATPARPLLDLLPEQNRYLFNADGSIGPAEQDFLDELDASIARIRSDQPMQATDTPLGLPVAYWRGFDRIDPVADALASNLPILLLQGGRDFQVIDTDWRLWKSALSDRDNVIFKYYPLVNHLGIAGEGRGSIQDYQTPGHVDATLINDIAAWIKQ